MTQNYARINGKKLAYEGCDEDPDCEFYDTANWSYLGKGYIEGGLPSGATRKTLHFWAANPPRPIWPQDQDGAFSLPARPFVEDIRQLWSDSWPPAETLDTRPFEAGSGAEADKQ